MAHVMLAAAGPVTDMGTILHTYRAYGLVAFVVTVFATPLAMRLARRLGVVDRPDDYLKPHARPTPYFGGLAIALGWSVAQVLALAQQTVAPGMLLPILLGGLAIVTVGLADDMRSLSPYLRLGLQTLIVAGVIGTTGVGLRLVDSITVPLGLELPTWLSRAASFLIAVGLVVVACSSTNLIDGLDGLCAGVTSIIALGFFLLATHLAVWGYSSLGDPVRLVLALAMFGAAVGFLPLNFHPARIFMGDAGSMLLGYNCGMLILLFAERGIFRWVIGALVIFGVPAFDTALAVYRRWRAGRPLFVGDRSHFYDQLVQRGLSVRQSVFICYALSIAFAALGLLLTWVGPGGPVIRTRWAGVLYLGLCVLIAWTAHLTRLTHPDEPASLRQTPVAGPRRND